MIFSYCLNQNLNFQSKMPGDRLFFDSGHFYFFDFFDPKKHDS